MVMLAGTAWPTGISAKKREFPSRLRWSLAVRCARAVGRIRVPRRVVEGLGAAGATPCCAAKTRINRAVIGSALHKDLCLQRWFHRRAVAVRSDLAGLHVADQTW